MPLFIKRWPLFLLALVAILPLWNAISNGETIGPFDQVRHLAPWNGPETARPIDILQADGVLQFYSWRDMVLESWGKGQVPAWNPFELAGTPLLANSQSGGFYPPHILLGILHVATPLALLVLAWLHLFWAGLGTYLLARKLGSSKAGGSLAGCAFALSPFMLGWTALPSVITTVSWIPWMLALIVSLFSEPPHTRAAKSFKWNPEVASFSGNPELRKATSADRRRHTFRNLAGLGACTAMMVLGGHLQFCAYGFLAAGLLAVYLTVERMVHVKAEAKGAVGKLALIVVALVLGLLLAAPQLLPVLSFAKFSHRANTASEQGYADYVGGAIPGYALQSVAFPTAVGNPTQPLEGGFKGENGYWPALSSRGMDFSETALSVGPLVFVLLFLMPRPKRASAALVLIGAVSLLLGLGTVANKPLYFLVPGWSASGSPGRVVVLFVLAASVLAGLAVDRLPSLPPKRIALTVAAAGLLGLLGALAPILFGIVYNGFWAPTDKIQPLIRNTVAGQLPLFLATLAIAGAAIALARYQTPLRAVLPIGAAACALLAYGWSLIPTGLPLSKISGDHTTRYAFINSKWPLVGELDSALAPPDTAAASRIHELAGYDSLMHRDTVAMLAAVDNHDAAAAANGNLMFVKPKADPKALEEAGVGQVLSLDILPQLGEPSQIIDGINVYLLKGNRVTGVKGTIEAEDYRSLRISASGPGKLVLKDRMMPGWTATVDGKPATVQAQDSTLGKGLWRSLDVPPGTHTVLFTYSPPGMLVGFIAAAFGLAAIGLLLFLGLRRDPILKFLPNIAGETPS
jgi:hypothetical protein